MGEKHGARDGAGDGLRAARSPRVVALVGPHGAGKTTILESMLWVTGALPRKGAVPAGTSAGDSVAESRAHGLSVEPNIAALDYLGERFIVIDCPGALEFAHEAEPVLAIADLAVIVADPDPAKAIHLAPAFRAVAAARIPAIVFVNKVDEAEADLGEFIAALESVAPKPVVMRQLAIWENGIVTGFIDLALERAYVYREHAASEVVPIPSGLAEGEKAMRFRMLERLADYDEHLMEELLSDIEPPRDEVFDDLAREMRDGLIVPVLMGSALKDNGIRRLLKALRHETPEVAAVNARLGAGAQGEALLQTFRACHTGQGGRLTFARVLAGTVKDGVTLHGPHGNDTRVGGLLVPKGASLEKRAEATAGEIVALQRLEGVETGDALTAAKAPAPVLVALSRPAPVFARAIQAADRNQEVKLSAAIGKLREEDRALTFDQNPETHEFVLGGQGEVHLKVALERLERKFGLTLHARPPATPYREAVRKTVMVRGRHKKQSGGHGQFGDVVLEIAPLPRGTGFAFTERVVGGAVPRQYIPSVEKGVREALTRGPLGFPVMDVAVTLLDGSYHSVDSSDAAFQMAARIAMRDGLEEAQPVLLEPVMTVSIAAPQEHTQRVTALVPGRRGQILGFDPHPAWRGYDVVTAYMPQADMEGLIVELRSATQGLGTFTATFDHFAELSGRLADAVVAHAKAA